MPGPCRWLCVSGVWPRSCKIKALPFSEQKLKHVAEKPRMLKRETWAVVFCDDTAGPRISPHAAGVVQVRTLVLLRRQRAFQHYKSLSLMYRLPSLCDESYLWPAPKRRVSGGCAGQADFVADQRGSLGKRGKARRGAHS